MKMVVTEPLHLAEKVKETLGALGTVVYGPLDDDRFVRELADCEVLMVRLGRNIGEPLIARAPKLRYILTATTGLDHIDLDAARRASVRVISLRDCQHAIMDVSATAEHTPRPHAGAFARHARGLGPCACRRLGPRQVLGQPAQGEMPRDRGLWAHRCHGRGLCRRFRHDRGG